ncbi:MAG: hypothetical protein IPG55_16650 [Saprospiraceae bacterium]|nr:hypothetical protein [Candidatus Defluviibacterium haderslevense]
MDKLDANITKILSAIQNAQVKIESFEGNISDKLKEATKKQTISNANFQEKFNQSISSIQNELAKNVKRQQTNTYITWAIIAIGFTVILILVKI